MEKFRVVLKNETPDYINASYVKVSECVNLIKWQEILGQICMEESCIPIK